MTTVVDEVAVLYASQTGTAEEVAWELAREGRKKGFPCSDPCAIDDIGFLNLCKLRTVIFLVSTTGQGDPPINMRKTWQQLVASTLPKALLSSLRFAVFGLGDSHYREFNYAARKLYARLQGLGAESFFRLGLGDDQHDFGMEQELDPWAEAMWVALMDFSPQKHISMPEASDCRYEVEEIGEESPERISSCETELSGQSIGVDEFFAGIVDNRKLCSHVHTMEEQDVRNIHLACPAGVSYAAGDVCVVWPQTDAALVNRFIVETLGLSPRKRILVRTKSQGLNDRATLFPTIPLTLQQIFTSYVDISAVPTRYFFHVLGMHTEPVGAGIQHREKLLEFASRSLEAKDALYEYCKREKRSAAEVMWDFWTARPPLAELLGALPPMRPRRYSIASCPNWHNPGKEPETAARFWCNYQLSCGPQWRFRFHTTTELAVDVCTEIISEHWRAASSSPLKSETSNRSCSLDLCVAVVEFTTKTGRECKGLCSSFLQGSSPGAFVRCAFERGTLSLPPIHVPLILVCPGTGLSPCRALVQERHLEVLRAKPESLTRFSTGSKDLMFLGFRHRCGDFLYEEEWPSFSNWLTVHTAFSRDDPDRKVYVQDLIEENGAHVCALLDAGAQVYICGRSHPMPSQVFDAFVEVLHAHRGLSMDLAAERLRTLQRNARYICDTWG